MEQFDPTKHGLYRRFLNDDGDLRSTTWNAAVEGGEHVGTCRRCGFYLLGRPTHQAGPIVWYGAYCTNPGCGWEMAAPNGEILRRSSRHNEMPSGFWADRVAARKEG